MKTFFLVGSQSVLPWEGKQLGNSFNYPPATHNLMPTSTVDSTMSNVLNRNGRFAKMFANITINTRNGSTTFNSKKNGSNANLTFTVPAGVTGLYTTTGAVDTVTINDTYVLENINAGTTGEIWANIIGGIFDADNIYVSTFAYLSQDVADGATRFGPINQVGTGSFTAESSANMRLKTGAVAKNLVIQISSNSRTTPTIVKLRKNGTDTGIAVAIPAGVGGTVTDLVNTATFAVDDLINYSVEFGAGIQSLTFLAFIELENSVAGFYPTVTFNPTTVSTPSTTVFLPIPVGASSALTQAQAQTRMPMPINVRNVQFFVSANTRSDSTVAIMQRNGVDTGVSVTIPAGSTGWFSSTSSIAMGEGDLLNWRVTTGAGTGSISVQKAYFDYTDTDYAVGGSNYLLMGV